MPDESIQPKTGSVPQKQFGQEPIGWRNENQGEGLQGSVPKTIRVASRTRKILRPMSEVSFSGLVGKLTGGSQRWGESGLVTETEWESDS